MAARGVAGVVARWTLAVVFVPASTSAIAASAGAGCGGAAFRSGRVSDSEDGAPPGDAGAVETGGRFDASPDAPDAPSAPPASCKELLERDPTLARQDGKRTIVLADGGSIDVWCDMTTDDGGWTLVGRSVSGQQTDSFGWNGQTGGLGNDAQPYSLGLTQNPIPFREILLGAHDGTKAWRKGGNVFKLAVPSDFLSLYKTSAVSLQKPTRMVSGTCVPTADGWMFNVAGYTENTSGAFYFADYDQGMIGTGLRSDGFGLADPCCDGDACDRTADLQGRPGMIFVR